MEGLLESNCDNINNIVWRFATTLHFLYQLIIWYIFQGLLKDSLERYSVYGLEENSSYDCNYKDEIEDVIKLVS